MTAIALKPKSEMIPADCFPANLNERVIEIIHPADREGKTTFFVYRLSHVHMGLHYDKPRVTGQIFKTNLTEYLKRLAENPVVEYRTVKHVGHLQ